ncbi:hypothetical protein GGI15_003344 [Coemansia interrupta]|uniref:Uncharacterized protein n=1 Tax=Coemansia interrupta TaxID=1126814 RepID=A0A9W8HD39_9FUNG|nr:hypothetical protein GGI15_003344 [Coemansia interrupta]
MDITITKCPFPLGGVCWSKANRYIIGTISCIFLVMPRVAREGSDFVKREASASIDSPTDIEAISLLDGLPEEFPFSDAIVALATDSSISMLANSDNPDVLNWTQVASHQLGSGKEHVVSISSYIATGSDGELIPVVACGSAGGHIEFIRFSPSPADTDNQAGGSKAPAVVAESLLHTAMPNGNLITHMAWLSGGASSTPDGHLFTSCTTDGTATLWRVSQDIDQIEPIASIGVEDWSAFTAHGVGSNVAVLAKIGMAAVIDTSPGGDYQVQYLPLEVSQTVVSCVVDDRRNKIYIGSNDFVIFVLARVDGKWIRAGEEETLLRNGLRKTIVRSFTTKFNMSQLFLRGMGLSPNGRYLKFAAE